MRLDGYLDRIGYGGPVDVSAETLRAVHRAHLLAIPYENFDIHLGRRLDLDPARFYRKLVVERRGGWCYEMNGLLAWALERIGFEVRLLSGTVGRAARGDGAEGNHLMLAVELGGTWIADVGFGDGLLEAVALAPGSFVQQGFEYGFETTGNRWVFRSHRFSGAPEFDFTLAPRRLDDFAERCHELQTSPTSSFTRTTVAERWLDEGAIVMLRGATFRRVEPGGATERVLADRADFEAVIQGQFGLDPEVLGPLWPAIERRQREWEAEQRALREAETNVITEGAT